MNRWEPDRQGFIPRFMVSGPAEEELEDTVKDDNPLQHEAELRKRIARHTPVPAEEMRPERLKVGQSSRLGQAWQVYYSYGACFVDLSTFYSLMRRVRFDAASVLVSDRERDVSAVLWSYAAIDLYCNGEKCAQIDRPVYKPMESAAFTLHLKPGRNLLYIAGENLGVRDTRSVFGIQLKGDFSGIAVDLPDEDAAAQLAAAIRFLDSARLERREIRFAFPAPEGTQITFSGLEEDLAKALIPPVWIDIGGAAAMALPEGRPYLAVRCRVCGAELVRPFERTEQLVPEYTPGREHLTEEENRRKIFERIASVMSENRGEGIGFPIVNILARKAVGKSTREDEKLLDNMLDLIDQRVDCADFEMNGLIRYMHCFGLPDKLAEKAKKVILNWRYWITMDGSDGMCYWSENHCLMFYTAAMCAGEMYPDDGFPRAHMTGRQLHAFGREKILEWLDDVEKNGYEEFLSAVYMCVTFAALLNVIDFAEPEISRRAEKLTDLLFEELALHVYKNGFIAPMGRVYRGVLYPFAEGAMAMMNLADPTLPTCMGEGWLAFLASSRYRLPAGLKERMRQDAECSWTTGNARIFLEKNQDYCLTSVASPREPFTRWPNDLLARAADPASNHYIKSFNEKFHGTTVFAPGTYGYQQHLWYAALDGEAVMFANHPGSTSESGDLRPGYWHGNGVMPALKQVHGKLGMIWRIPENHPIHFIHLYLPECRFDEVRIEDGESPDAAAALPGTEKPAGQAGGGSWMIARKGSGYLAFWASRRPEPFSGMNADCEMRYYGDDLAAVCFCGGAAHGDADFASFLRRVKAETPVYDPVQKTLTSRSLSLQWVPGEDRTQYL